MTPIKEAVDEYVNKGLSRFHMPGHKGGECFPGYYKYDITNLIREYRNEYSKEDPNNLFFTTSALRDYHYLKQKNNAYYHIQAINLPFQNIEFYYIDKEEI